MELRRANIQGNILEGYRYPHASHVFVRFRGAEEGRRLLRRLPEVANAVASPRHTQATVLNVGLSHAGLQALLPGDARLQDFPEEFRQGMESRAAKLKDNLELWSAAWRGRRVHLWLAVHGSDRPTVDACALGICQELALDGDVLAERKGDALGSPDEPFEHFGFRDGLSNPSVVGATNARRPGGGKPLADGGWAPLATGEFVLGYPDESGETHDGPLAELTRDGTFVVFRVLSQDVAAFRRYVQLIADQTGQSADAIAAYMVGRRRDGTPLLPAGTTTDPLYNDFRYADDPYGSACPLGSHVRRGNLRDSTGFPDLVSRHRIIRRGMPYGAPLPEGVEHAEPDARGLLFVCMNASIERQFEFVQAQWINDGSSVHQATDCDPLVGSHAGPGKFVIQGDAREQRAPLICPNLPRFVECVGGEYFFMPGLHALRRLADESAAGGAAA